METDEELFRLVDECSNWGRWGDDDELGTLNYITDSKRAAAAGLVVTGRAFSIGKDLSTVASAANKIPVFRLALHEPNAPGAPLEFIGIAPHNFAMTHIDAIGHCFWKGMTYNGREGATVVTPEGLTFVSISAMREGIFTRGVMLDVAAARGVEWLPPDAFVTGADLEAAEAKAGSSVKSGDAVLVRVGVEARELVQGPEDVTQRAGLSAEAVAWLHRREVAVFGGDCIERLPYPSATVPLPLHQIGLARMGLVLLESLDMELLRRICLSESRHEFLLTVAPLRLPGVTGSPVNPIVVF